MNSFTDDINLFNLCLEEPSSFSPSPSSKWSECSTGQSTSTSVVGHNNSHQQQIDIHWMDGPLLSQQQTAASQNEANEADSSSQSVLGESPSIDSDNMEIQQSHAGTPALMTPPDSSLRIEAPSLHFKQTKEAVPNNFFASATSNDCSNKLNVLIDSSILIKTHESPSAFSSSPSPPRRITNQPSPSCLTDSLSFSNDELGEWRCLSDRGPNSETTDATWLERTH